MLKCKHFAKVSCVIILAICSSCTASKDNSAGRPQLSYSTKQRISSVEDYASGAIAGLEAQLGQYRFGSPLYLIYQVEYADVKLGKDRLVAEFAACRTDMDVEIAADKFNKVVADAARDAQTRRMNLMHHLLR